MNTTLVNHIKSSFLENFNKLEPLLVFSPGRINIIGEHTDYNDGFVFPAAINKGIITAIQTSTADFCTVVAADFNEIFEFSLMNKIQPIPNGGWKNYILGVVAEIQKKGFKLEAFNVVFGGDIPVGSGLSSSAALENSIVFGLNELFGLSLSKKEMILISQQAEHNYVGVRCGIMDQYASMFGKENSALFLDCRTIEAIEIDIDLKEYQLVLINTNVKHSLSESAYNNRRSVCEKVASLLNISALREAAEESLLNIRTKISEEDYQKALFVIQENKRVEKAVETLNNNDIPALGKLLYESHNGLQNQFKVSCDELDFLVDRAKENQDVAGARMMGGGFGGCTINIIAKNASKLFINEVSNSYQKKFLNKCSFYFVEISEGTHLITI
ncbi:MAG: galactokinase [Bacteroidetes bacterium HGW-Bacteroidetes-18]|nr:MAG: galactokinase [Bacteroidetes bacterium HGW-Bacteroidetes-18]